MRVAGAPWPWGLICLAALLLLTYAVVLGRLMDQWLTNDDMGHGMFVPILVGYIVWRKRDELAGLPAVANWWGWGLMVLGALMLCIGPPGLPTFTFITRMALIFSLVGTVLFLRGTATIVALAYPFLLLLLMMPVPNFVYERVTLPLQLVASSLSERILELLGYSVLREGNILHLPNQALAVAEACSGLRSLLSLTFFGQAYIYLFDRKPWMRAAIAAATVPIAILANAGRIVFAAIASQHDRSWLSGFLHGSTGWTVFAIAFLCVVLVHRVVNRTYRMAQERGRG